MDTLFFIISKIFWIVASPDSLLVILCLLGFYFLRKGKYHTSKLIFTILLVSMLIISFIPIGNLLLKPLEDQYQPNPVLPDQVDGIIVLGGAELAYLSGYRQQPQLNKAAERELAFIRFIQQYPDAKHVFTGGSSSLVSETYNEADVSRDLLLQFGINTSKIIFENKARNTFENAKLTYEIVKPGKNENWVLITTAWHMPRAVGAFKKNGWTVIPYPVDYQTSDVLGLSINPNLSENLYMLKVAIKEWTGLVAYRVAGKLEF